MDEFWTHEPAVPTGLPELSGVRLLWCEEFYDGPLDGLAGWRGGEHWFIAVGPVWEQPRRYVLHELTAEQATAAWRLHRLLDGYAQASRAGDAEIGEAWDRAWADRPDHRTAPLLGWFTA